MTEFARLTAEDLLYLRVERPEQPCHFSALLVLGDAGPFNLAAAREELERRSARVPKLRQRVLRTGPLGGRPVWVDDAAFDIRRHVRAVPVPAPGDDAALLAAGAREHERRLGRAHPLWELVLLTGPGDGCAGALLKLHHAVADGIAALTVMAALLDSAPDVAAAVARPVPTTGELVRDNLASKARTLRRVHRPAGGMMPDDLARGFFGGSAAAGSSLNAPVGPGRVVKAMGLDLAGLRRVAQTGGGTINDLVLTLWAGGLRSLLLSRRDPAARREIITSVPVSLRAHGAGDAVDNRTGTMVVPLPVGESDPLERLRIIAQRTRGLKGRQQPDVIMGLLAALVATPLGRYYTAHQSATNVLATNVRGPAEPVRLLGAPVLRVLPMMDLVGNLGLVLAAFSYAGRMELVVTADAAAFPDLDVLMAGMAWEWVLLDGQAQEPIDSR